MKKTLFLVFLSISLLKAEYFRNDEVGVVLDTDTALLWQNDKNAVKKNWKDAVEYCENLNLGGLAGWRLPTAYELISIDFNKFQDYVSYTSDYFRDNGLWSSSRKDDFSAYSLIIFFNDIDYIHDKNTFLKPIEEFSYVRCVRNVNSSSLKLFKNKDFDGDGLIENDTFIFLDNSTYDKNNDGILDIVDQKAINLLSQTYDFTKNGFEYKLDKDAKVYITKGEIKYELKNTNKVFSKAPAPSKKYVKQTYKGKSFFKIINNLSEITNTTLVNSNANYSSPFNISPNNGYRDTLNKLNLSPKNTKYFKINSFNPKKQYILLIKPQSIENAVIISNGKKSQITLTLYEDGNAIGSKVYNPTDSLEIPLAFKEGKSYTLSLAIDQNLKNYQYNLSLQELNDERDYHLYFEKLIFDDKGKLNYTFFLPLDSTYTIKVISLNKQDILLKKSGNLIATFKDSEDVTFNEPLKAGGYTISATSKPKNEIYLIVDYSNTKKEIEPNDTFSHPMYYEKSTYANISPSDIDLYRFQAGYFSGTISGLNPSDSFDIYVLDKNKNDVGYLYKMADSKGNLDFEFNLPDGKYTLKLVPDNLSKNNTHYTITLNNVSKIENKNEKAYKALYEQKKVEYKITLTDQLDTIITKTYKHPGNLIILTGDSDNPSDSLFKASQKLSKTFYNRFLRRGLGDDDIFWHNFESDIDIDNDGINDKVVDDTTPTVKKFLDSITTWAKEQNHQSPLYIYMVDHGSNEAFKISAKDHDNDGKKEILYASALKDAIDSFIEETNRDVILIIEACKSGSFIPILKESQYKDKIAIITSSEKEKLSYIDAFGDISFTKLLVNEILSGKSIKKAYEKAKSRLASLGGVYKKQVPLLFVGSNNLADITVGGSFDTALVHLTSINDISINGNSDTNPTLSLQKLKDIKIEATLTLGSGINRVWATVIPPNFPTTSKKDFITPDLTPYTIELKNDNDKYIGTYKIKGTVYSGNYDISVYVEDEDGFISSKSISVKVSEKEDTSSDNNNTNTYKPIEQNVTVSLSLNEGWNLVSLEKNIDSFSCPIILIWKFHNNKWQGYSPLSYIQKILENIPVISTINNITNKDGIWIYAEKHMDINYTKTIKIDMSYLKQLPNGWSLNGTIKDISVSSLECKNRNNSKIVWKFKNNMWYANSDLKKFIDLNVESFDTIKANEGFWVNCL